MITPVLVAVWVAGGAFSAFGGWLFNKVVHDKMDALEARLKTLEEGQH